MLSTTSPIPFDLHQGVVNPENLSLPDPSLKKKKKKKRQSEENDQDSHNRKKRKHYDDSPQDQDSSSADPTVKKKKRKKDKGKDLPQAEPSIDDVNAQATALLSAIVAAAAGNPVSDPPPQMAFPPPYHPHMPPPEHQHFGQYQAVQDGFNPYAQPLFPTPTDAAGAFSDINFGSNEDVLRALQDLDISKIANVLRTLGEAAAAANFPSYPPQPGFVAPPMPEPVPPTPLGQLPVASNAILGLPPKAPAPPNVPLRKSERSFGATDSHTSPDHAYLLANKWLNASKLSELVANQGLVYKKGKFSTIEDRQLEAAIEHYKVSKQVTDEQIQELVFPQNEKNKDNAFWSELTSAVAQRPIIAVYHHVRRMRHPNRLQGPWKRDENDRLKQAVADLGQQWEKVADRVGRPSSDCRDRYRNHILNRDIRVSGHWSKEEEDKLTRIVTDMTINQGKDADNDVFWGRVSELMGGTRGRQQCRIKWTDALNKTIKNRGQKPRWSQQDAFILVHKVDSLNVRDDTEIDWKTIPDPDWNLWSAHTLQRRWMTMKKAIKGWYDMRHEEIMDILREKKAQLPPVAPAPVTRKRKERKVTSAADIIETDVRTAGSSTGPGTLAANEDSESSSDESTDSE